MSNFLCVKAYFAVPMWRFLHKIKWLSRTAVSQFSHLSNQNVVVDYISHSCSKIGTTDIPRKASQCSDHCDHCDKSQSPNHGLYLFTFENKVLFMC